MAIVCANCESDQIQAVPFVFENGTSHINSATVGGFGFIGAARGLGPFAARTTGTQRSATAQRLAPPIARHVWRYFAFGGLLFLMSPSAFSNSAGPGLVVFALAAFLIWRGWTCLQWNRTVLPQLVATWRASYLCLRCGTSGFPKTLGPRIVGDTYDAVPTRPSPQLEST